ncbi:Flp family type IVb pilin [Gluconacetobacter takamatsuzukensis]|uniref:Flp family type IVb pilin n=1 Tax=Gluconacetobacter takamatsuzukensis TaxID=1286190 RepID=A0A7W4KD87_9PROT|nr:Flp family type IVb pilin [Gluconacetobacter takamatsuzukensis]MBB2204793.1 Flp family type IVb pilin [Gluconacetobacter takamatsuzukensis]
MLRVSKRLVSVARGLRGDRRGVTALEYGLIAALIAAVIMGSVSLIGGKLNNTFSSINAQLGSSTSS